MVTDLILGFHNTMLFTWGSMLLVSGIGLFLRDRRSLMNVLGGSFLSAVVFFLVTNFGAWLTLYPATMNGLKECYVMAIPFFRTTLLSTMAYSVVLFLGFELLLKRSEASALARVRK
jgi:hypothetical protein